MSDDRHLVVVGASLAGLRAVEAARTEGFEGRITLIGAERHLPYDRPPPLSKAYLDKSDEGPVSTEFRAESVITDQLDVKLLLGTAAVGLDTADRIVFLADGREVRYDALVIATGAQARSLPGTADLAGVHTLRTVDDAVSVRAALDAGARTVVIGAGFIGSEVASGARKRGGLVPVVIEALPTPLVRAVGQEMGAVLASLHTRNGTDLRCGVGVASIEGDGRVQRVVLEDGTVIDADLVVVGAGAIPPAVEWLEGAGLTIDNGVVCDENLWTGVVPPHRVV